MATFSVDITEVRFAATNTGYKDITISNMPSGGVNCSITGKNASSFGFRIPGSEQNVYRVYTTSHSNIGVSEKEKTGTFKITNLSDSTDYVEVSLLQCSYYGEPEVRGVENVYDNIYAYYSGDAVCSAEIFADYRTDNSGTYAILYVDGYEGTTTLSESWAYYTADSVYTDTGFRQIKVGAENNYDSVHRMCTIRFPGESGTGNASILHQNPYPSSTAGCTSPIRFSGSGGTERITLKTDQQPAENIDYKDWYSNDGLTYTIVETGSGTLYYDVTVGPNQSDKVLRGAILFMSNKIYGFALVFQEPSSGPVPTLTVDPSVLTYPSSGGERVMDVTYATSLSTNESSFPDWLGATYVSTGQGSGSYTITAASNTSTSSRSFDFELADVNMSLIVPITQEAGSSPSSISVSPSSLSFGADASYADISLTYGGTHYDTDAQEVYTWVTVNMSDTETGKASGTVSVASNTTTESRSGNVYFSDELGASIALPIEQAGISFALSANPSTLNIPAKGGSVTTAVTYEGTLSAASLPSWLSETHTDTDANHRTYTVTAASNGPTQERTFNWRLDDSYNHCWVYISQPAAEVPSMVISPTSSSVGSSAGTVDITVRSTNISDISYSISDSWITYSSKSGSVYTFSYEDNTTTSQRQGTITFSGGGISKTYTLTQAAGEVTPTEPTLTISPVSKSVSNTSGSVNVTVTSSNISDVSYSISGDWITYSSKSGDVYTFNYTANTTTSQRQGTITFSGGGISKTFTLSQEGQGGSNPLSVSPTELNFTASGDTKSVTVSGGTGTIAVNTGSFPSWLSIASVGNGVYNITASENSGVSRSFDVWFTDEAFTTVIVKVSQSGAPGPEPEPVEDRSLKVYPKKLRYYSDGGRILVSFTNRPDSGIGYEITYTDGSGWLSVEGVSPNMYVSATANDGIRRRAEIKFYDLSDNTNYVIVPVIQGSVGGYNSIWMDDLYYPENRDASGNYFYKVVNQDTGQIYFMGISSKPLSWTGNIGGIDIPRLVDNYIKSDFVQQNTGEDWADMHSGYCTVDIYNMAETNSVVDATFKYWNDWSRFERKYDYTRSLNDPINGKGCNNMIIPFCVYYDDAATFTIVDTEKNGNINTYTLSSPTSPFVMRYNSYYDIKKLEYKQDDDVLFSYDMNHCGPGAFIYRNRFGGWDSFLIEGNISKTDNYTKQNYRIKGEYNQEYVINTLKYIDEKRTDSIDIDTTYEASTGWLTDEESERLVFHLLSSPIVYFQNLHKENQLYDTDSLDIIPVRITASSSEYKKFRNGRRLVNYLITFEKCNIEKVRQ